MEENPLDIKPMSSGEKKETSDYEDDYPDDESSKMEDSNPEELEND